MLTLMFLTSPFHLNAGDKFVTDQLPEVVSEVERLNRMRSDLATTFGQRDVKADEQTFKTVCKPVGAEMKRVAKKKTGSWLNWWKNIVIQNTNLTKRLKRYSKG